MWFIASRLTFPSLAMPVQRGLHLALDERLHQVRADDVLPEALLLEQLQVAQCWTWVGQVLEVRRPGPVLEVIKVRDEGRLRKELLGGQVV
jgi:hypothetical protein